MAIVIVIVLCSKLGLIERFMHLTAIVGRKIHINRICAMRQPSYEIKT